MSQIDSNSHHVENEDEMRDLQEYVTEGHDESIRELFPEDPELIGTKVEIIYSVLEYSRGSRFGKSYEGIVRTARDHFTSCSDCHTKYVDYVEGMANRFGETAIRCMSIDGSFDELVERAIAEYDFLNILEGQDTDSQDSDQS